MKPTWQERLNYMSDERVQEALRQREAYIKAKEPPIIELNSIDAEYRCVEANYYEQAIKDVEYYLHQLEIYEPYEKQPEDTTTDRGSL